MPRTFVELRRATVEDVELLLGLAQRAGVEESGHCLVSRSTQRQRVHAALNRSDVTVLLACAGTDVVGALVLRVGEILPLSGTDAVHIEQLYVQPSWRSKGVARQLLSAALSAAERHGAGDITCVAPPTARHGQRFLARLGFAPVLVQRVVSTSTLRRRLQTSADGGRGRSTIDPVLVRRRRQARGRAAALTPVAPAADT